LPADVECLHNNDTIVNCSSPLVVTAKDFNSSANNFTVMFTDVCGDVQYANYSYTPFGVNKISVAKSLQP